MNTFNKSSESYTSQSNFENKNKDTQTADKNVKDKTEELYNQTKEVAGDLYNEGIKKVNEAQEHLKQYSDELAATIKEKPLTSLLIAGGIGFIIAALLKK